MKTKNYLPMITTFAICLASCSTSNQITKIPNITPLPTNPSSEEPANIWSSLLQVTPFPYASPLPASESTALDGTYAKYNPTPPQWWNCARCADYRQAGGVWRIQFDKGTMRIYYEVTGWHSLASYTVSGDHLYLFNDPYCRDVTGEYRWKLTNGNLILEAIGDSCSLQLRAENLSEQPWAACQVNTTQTEEPRGCRDTYAETGIVPTPPSGLTVTVYEGDARLTSSAHHEYLNASGADQSTLDGVRLNYSNESLIYGTNRVLWTDEDWIEIITKDTFSNLGVQFRGDYVIGWARVLFDGEEVWRGDTSKIWSDLKIHGGYIEVSGFEAGQHTLRVERLTIDSRPVIVAFFGFDR